MGLRDSARRRTCWLLLTAFLYAVLMPSLGMASGKDAAARTVLLQLCNATGHEAVAIELPAGEDGAKAAAGQLGSGFCLLCVHPATAPGVAVALAEPARAGFAVARVPDAAGPPLSLAWRPALARAPPVLTPAA